MPADRSARDPRDLSPRGILLFWAPLAATWLMMAAEGPFLAAVVARLPEPTLGLAAYGVAIAIAVLVEAPVIMLLSAATALVEDALGYRRLRAFANGLNALATGALLFVLWPPVRELLFTRLLDLPPTIAELTGDALWWFLPWPAAIGYRRFLQGVLIRSNETRLVAYGTVIRLIGMAAGALALAALTDLPGPSVGAAALSTGVVIEAVTARWMARRPIRVLLSGAEEEAVPIGEALGYREIAAFYYPLALTSLIGLAIQPMLTFFMSAGVAPVESLAVFPVVGSLAFIFRAVGLSFQDAVIALLGTGRDGYPEIRRFAVGLGTVMSLLLVGIAFTPASSVWFQTISGLSPELASYAVRAARVIAPIPFLGVWLSLERGVLMKNRRTGPITWATALEIVAVAAAFVAVGRGLGWVGATSAFTAILVGRLAANLYLVLPARRALSASNR
ncbi:MAG: hypothetical protein MJB57_02525 [Gemmatimonadetes bacterium]|nr:hypothetical protein [Gemmatimonadota bacterium]